MTFIFVKKTVFLKYEELVRSVGTNLMALEHINRELSLLYGQIHEQLQAEDYNHDIISVLENAIKDLETYVIPRMKRLFHNQLKDHNFIVLTQAVPEPHVTYVQTVDSDDGGFDSGAEVDNMLGPNDPDSCYI